LQGRFTPTLQFTPVLIKGGGFRQFSLAFMNGKSPQQHPLHHWSEDSVPSFVGKLAIPQLMRQTNRPLDRWVLTLSGVEVRYPHLGSMLAHHFFNHPAAPAGPNHVPARLVILKDPFPLVMPLHPRPGFVATNQSAPAQPLQNLRHSVIQAQLDPL
jgi:hypothetical protein